MYFNYVYIYNHIYICILLTLTNMILNLTLNQAIWDDFSASEHVSLNPVQAFLKATDANHFQAKLLVPGSFSKTLLGKQEPVPEVGTACIAAMYWIADCKMQAALEFFVGGSWSQVLLESQMISLGSRSPTWTPCWSGFWLAWRRREIAATCAPFPEHRLVWIFPIVSD